MRVIAGKFKGRRLLQFQAAHIRPTTDRVKETLFNKLMNCTDGARVLDLFSGTGNLAIEAISRGAQFVDLVESHPKSLKIIKANLSALGLSSGFAIHPFDAFQYISNYAGEPYDLVLCDPPFTRAWADDLARAIGNSRLLHEGSVVVIEASAQEKIEAEYPGLIRTDQRAFGDKTLNFFAQSHKSAP